MAPGGKQAEVTVEAAGLTDVGHEREANEDAFLIATLQRTMEVHDASPGAHGWFKGAPVGTLLVVADGMGGQGGGAVASRTAVNAVADYLLNVMPWAKASGANPSGRPPASTEHTARHSQTGVRAQLSSALVAGDAQVKTTGAQTNTPQMGTTLTVALVLWPALYVAHVGDTRCYLLQSGTLWRLTTDHNLAQRLADESAALAPKVAKLRELRSYGDALALIATLRPTVDLFFDKVMVLDPDEKVRGAHLGLIDGALRGFSGIADFSEIVTG